jgi:DNA repair protein SbcD/Mre11
VKFLHTSDWHVGKNLRGRSRIDEQRAVLGEIVDITRREQPDAVLIAGDLYDSSVPSADAQSLVVRTLLALRDTGAEVLVIAGNHDHPKTFDAYRPLMAAVGINMLGSFLPPTGGGVTTFHARSTGEKANVALLPFLSQRYVVRAADLIDATAADNAASYDQRVRDIVNALATAFTDDAVNVVMSHLTVVGGFLGGGERSAQTIFEYYVNANAFPPETHYVALGHLHRRQTMPAPCPVVYCGAPLAVDFGEQDNTPVVCMVRATSSTPAEVTDVPITTGRRLRTVHGTVTEILNQAHTFGNDYLRVVLREPSRAGIKDEITDILPNVLEVRIDADFAATTATHRSARTGKSPEELFAEFCIERGIVDPRIASLFTELHDELTSADTGEAV